MSPDFNTFDAILSANQGPVRAYVAGMGIPMHAVDDVAQEVFLAYYRKPEACPAGVELARWLKGIARHLALAWFRRNAGSAQRMTLLEEIEAHDPVQMESSDDLRLEALRLCLGGVSGTARTLLDAHYQDDESAEAIAQRRGVGASTVRMALLRLRERLRVCVERRMADRAAS